MATAGPERAAFYTRAGTALKIAWMGHPVLLEQCRPVTDTGAPEIRRRVRDMFDTLPPMGFNDEMARAEELALRLDTIRAQWAATASGSGTAGDLSRETRSGCLGRVTAPRRKIPMPDSSPADDRLS